MSKFSVFQTGNKEYPIEINNGEGFGIQLNADDAKVVISGLLRVRLQLNGWTAEAEAFERAIDAASGGQA